MYYTEPVPTWAKTLLDADFPHQFFITFSAIVSTTTALLLNWTLAGIVIEKLTNLILPAADPVHGQAGADFINNLYMPVLHNTIEDVHISIT